MNALEVRTFCIAWARRYNWPDWIFPADYVDQSKVTLVNNEAGMNGLTISLEVKKTRAEAEEFYEELLTSYVNYVRAARLKKAAG